MGEVHPASLRAPEEDHLLLLPAFGCILLVLAFPRHPELWRLARLDSWPPDERRALLELYRSCLQRHLYVVGPEKTILSKNPSFTGAILTLADAFPDARFLCCVRDPTEAVPSQLSSVRGVMGFFGVPVAAPDVRERFVSMMQHYAEHALTAAVALPEDRFGFVALSAVRADLTQAVEQSYTGFGWEITSAFRQALEAQSVDARSYASAHRYALQDLGLSSRDLEVRFAAFTERFRFDELAAGPAARSSSPTGPSG